MVSYFDIKGITHQFLKIIIMKNILFIVSLCFVISCAPNLYIPNMQNIPAFKEKNEFKGNIAKADLGIDLHLLCT